MTTRRTAAPSRMRRGSAVAYVLVALVIIGISVLLVRSRGQTAEAPAKEPDRFAGARTVREIQSHLRPASLDGRLRVALVREAGSAGYYDAPADFAAILDHWTKELEAIGAEVSVVPSDRIGDARAADVLVLPGSPCVGAPARRAIDLQLSRGKGVILTWLAGVRDGGCRETGWQMVVGLTGASRADTLRARKDAYITVPWGGPLSYDIPPGARLEVLVANHVALRHPARDAFWSDFVHNPEPAAGSPLLDAAIVHAEKGAGRVVYWGFDLSRVVASDWNRDVARTLLRNSVAWAAGRALGTVEPWPEGRRVAAVIAQDVEDEFANGRFALDSLRAAGVRGTFFLVSDLAQQNAEIARAMAQHGEIGTHTENHGLLGGTPDSAQRRRLALTQRDLQKRTGRRVAGLRPPEEQFDVETLEAWVAAGGTYVFATNNARSASPEIVSAGTSNIVLMGRNSNDDFLSVRKLGRDDPKVLAAEYLAAYEKSKQLGGLYLLSYHSQMLSTAKLVPTIGTVARRLAGDREAWVTTAGEVARWWQARHDLTVVVRAGERGSLEVTVTNAGRLTAHHPVIAVALPPGMESATPSSGTALDAPRGVARVQLEPLAPGRVLSFMLTTARGTEVRDAD